MYVYSGTANHVTVNEISSKHSSAPVVSDQSAKDCSRGSSEFAKNDRDNTAESPPHNPINGSGKSKTNTTV